MTALRVLVACEFSGTVRDAFRALGHDAMSCDLLPTEAPGPHHQGDVLDILGDGWDLMVGHPPCTYLANSGARWLWQYDKVAKRTITDANGQKIPEWRRWRDMEAGALFFRALLEAPIPRVAIENPGIHGHAVRIIGRKQDQVIHPWMFGHTEQKATGLWLRGLPPLIVTEDVQAAMLALPYAERAKVHSAPPSADRWKIRSVTFPGIAAAMAAQWGALDRIEVAA